MDDEADFGSALERSQDLYEAEAKAEAARLPVPLDAPSDKPSLVRTNPTASFVSQLIAERHHLSSQRDKRRESVDTAVGAYADKAASTVRRMPTGYRKTVIA